MGTNPRFTELGMKRREDDNVCDYGYALRNSLKRLDESEILSEGDKKLIQGFLEHLRAEGQHWEVGEVVDRSVTLSGESFPTGTRNLAIL
jgi:hypothetical protein